MRLGEVIFIQMRSRAIQEASWELEERVEIALLIGAVFLRSHISLVLKAGLRKVKPMPWMWA